MLFAFFSLLVYLVLLARFFSKNSEARSRPAENQPESLNITCYLLLFLELALESFFFCSLLSCILMLPELSHTDG